MEQATREHFYNHGKKPASPSENCHWCQLRSLPTQDTIPITIVNDVDSQVLPKDFRFINSMVLGKGVEPAEDSFRSGCSCADDGSCQYTGCLCLADLEDDEDMNMNDGVQKAYAYHTHGAKAGILRSRLQNSTVPLYECHKGCACSRKCPNRVVERGRTVPLQIFKTENRGWGVRSQAPIKRGQFVDRYLGEIITAQEADRRRANSAVSQQKDVYLFALDKFTDPDSLDPRLNGPPLEVDGEFMSGPTRFINHSCDPNLRIFARVGDHADKHIHDLALFAIKDIQRGEELTFDYVDGVTDEQDELDGNVEEGTMSGFRLPRQKRRLPQQKRLKLADAQAEQLKTWLISISCSATIFEENEFNENEDLVADIHRDYKTAAAESIMAGGAPHALGMQHAVQTFFESPVVRAAFGEFKAPCNGPEGIPVVEDELVQALAFFITHFISLPDLETRNIRVSWQNAKWNITDSKLRQLVMEYLVRIEIWRLRGLADGRPWTFGTQRTRNRFLATTLTQLWYMDNEVCFHTREIQTCSRDWNILWDSWVDKCAKSDTAVSVAKAEKARVSSSRLSSTDGEADEDVCVGVGRRPTGWLENA